jgi:annexin A7/11
LKSELGGNFEDVIVGLVLPPIEYLCKQLNKALSGFTTDTTAVIEILCCRSKKSLQEIVTTYERCENRNPIFHNK